MIVYKRFKGESKITPELIEDVVKRTEDAGYYKPGTVEALLQNGQIIETSFALYSTNKLLLN